ncbi:hypothetical protein PROFUN_01522 [Planoprotostelium fungivorum]|uniref:Uncharacterized protein n=1 Tax=Planoprotostelium fungivorum TaxID=1890364 RepID=A0A2P6NTK8_9EUKA|nr:hypothetical protein PROFUN_01522 [Planoprotostelium fungivorum]
MKSLLGSPKATDGALTETEGQSPPLPFQGEECRSPVKQTTQDEAFNLSRAPFIVEHVPHYSHPCVQPNFPLTLWCPPAVVTDVPIKVDTHSYHGDFYTAYSGQAQYDWNLLQIINHSL